MIEYTYGEFSKQQMEEYKKKLHNKMFFLLLYEDPKTKDQYEDVNVDKYFYFLLLEIDGLNRILDYPKELVEMQCILHKARCIRRVENFEYVVYRKLVLDAHSLLDKGFREVIKND